jgi:hypothetical protein
MVPTGGSIESGSKLVTVSAADAVIDGMTINGSNSASSASPYTAKGANLQVDTGVYVTASGAVVQNSVIKNTYQFGVVLGDTGSTVMYGQVLNNLVDNTPYFSGIVARNNYYAKIDSNTVRDAWRGIQTNNHSLPAPSGSDVRISNNTIDAQAVTIVGDNSYADVNGIMHNLQYDTATAWTITGNTVSNSDALNAVLVSS